MRNEEHEDDFDRLLKQAVQERMRGFEPSATEELWERFERLHLRGHPRRRRRAWFRLAAAAAALLMFVSGAGVLIYPEQVKAVGQRVVTIVSVSWEGSQGGIQFSFQERGLMPDPPPEDGPPSPEAAREAAPFPIFLPSRVPDGYNLIGHTYRGSDGAHGELTTDYFGNGFFISVRQSNCDSFGSQYGEIVDPEVRVTSVKVLGVDGKLIKRDRDGWANMSWKLGDVYYMLSGRMSAEQILQMAESMGEV